MSLLMRRRMMIGNEQNDTLIGINLIDFTKVESGYVINSNDGSLMSNASWSTTDFMEVDSTRKYEITSSGRMRYGLYDLETNFIYAGEAPNSLISMLNTYPETKYIRISYMNGNSIIFKRIE